MSFDSFVKSDYIEGFNRRKTSLSIPRSKDFGLNMDVLNRLMTNGSKVLDFGCGNSSLGFLGYNSQRDITVFGLDRDKNNKAAMYHDLGNINDFFDTIIFSHVLEHCQFNEWEEILLWAHEKCKRIIICLPNTDNVFVSSMFYKDVTHVKPLDNDDFIYYVEKLGYKLKHITVCSLGDHCSKRYIPARFLFAVLTGTSPFCNKIYVLEVTKDLKTDPPSLCQ